MGNLIVLAICGIILLGITIFATYHLIADLDKCGRTTNGKKSDAARWYMVHRMIR